MENWQKQSESYKTDINDKESSLVEARAEFYDMLGLDQNPTLNEVRAALTRKQAQIEQLWGITQGVVARRYNISYHRMMRSAINTIDSNVQYMQFLNKVLVDTLAAPAKRSEERLGKGIISMMQQLGENVLSYFPQAVQTALGRKATKGVAAEAITSFTEFSNELSEFQGRQAAELQALKDFAVKNADLIKNTSPFTDTTYLEAFQSMIDGRIKTLRIEYEQGVNALLKKHGIKATFVVS
jgi:hypothetical protein